MRSGSPGLFGWGIGSGPGLRGVKIRLCVLGLFCHRIFSALRKFRNMQPIVLITAGIVLIVLIAALFLFFERWTKHREREWMFLLKAENNKAMAPLRISAIERLVVMLERITPTSLVMRHSGASSSGVLQLELVRAIREEFEHNVSLQMYVSSWCWERIIKAKEDTAELVKVAFTRVAPDAKAMELSREIFRLEAAVGNASIKDALAALRAEIEKGY